VKRRPTAEERALAAGRQVGHGAGRTPLATRHPEPLPAPHVSGGEVWPFHNSGPMSAGRTNPQSVLRGGSVVIITIVADDVAGVDSTFQFVLNGTLTGDVITLASGDSEAYWIQGVDTVPRDKINLECLTAGSGLGNLGGHIRIN
jgi:hypothetical protein